MFARDWPDTKFKHACNMLAQMLDNDQDGCADDVLVVKTIRYNQAGVVLYIDEDDARDLEPKMVNNFFGQELYEDDCQPTCSGSDETSQCRDTSIEEIFHVISQKGLSTAYPKAFGECIPSSLAGRSALQIGMDKARGGYFLDAPDNYPDGAIYHYYEDTCEYDCQGTEFIYLALTSILGGQDKQSYNNDWEWEASTKALVQQKLPDTYKLLTDGAVTSMKLLTTSGVLPGAGGVGAQATYKPSNQVCPNTGGCSLNGNGCGPLGNRQEFEVDVCNTRETDADPCSVCNENDRDSTVIGVSEKCGDEVGARYELKGIDQPKECEGTESAFTVSVKCKYTIFSMLKCSLLSRSSSSDAMLSRIFISVFTFLLTAML